MTNTSHIISHDFFAKCVTKFKKKWREESGVGVDMIKDVLNKWSFMMFGLFTREEIGQSDLKFYGRWNLNFFKHRKNLGYLTELMNFRQADLTSNNPPEKMTKISISSSSSPCNIVKAPRKSSHLDLWTKPKYENIAGKINKIPFMTSTHHEVRACWIRSGSIKTQIVKQSKLMVLLFVSGSFNDEFIKDDIYNEGKVIRPHLEISWDGLNQKKNENLNLLIQRDLLDEKEAP